MKAEQSDVIKVIFNIYDTENKGYIEKEEFIKMLYNYPKADFNKFYDEVFEAERGNIKESKNGDKGCRMQRFDSITNLKPLIINLDLSDLKKKKQRKRANTLWKQS